MPDSMETYLKRLFNTGERQAVLEECLVIASEWLPSTGGASLRRAWSLTEDLYKGRFPGYAACNTEYHDYFHTCDVFGATVRVTDGAVSGGRELSESLREDLCIAALLHDAGYIQEADDADGTGAKFTKTHVVRSMQFALRHREAFGLETERPERIGRLISATDLALDFSEIPFKDGEERFAAELLASADLLGQMADRTYLEKLLFLYYEFKEAGFPGYATEFDMLRKTLGFYEMTKDRLFRVLGNASKFAFTHFQTRYGVAKNIYLDAIERQMDYLRSIMEDDSENFRKKLKRMDLEAISKSRQAS